jgi:tetratricopeptide (TPR) repeat protein
MHDLTYKPVGFLEPRLELLMQAFGDTLEQVERQSQAVRGMILERWTAEATRRRLAHAELFLTVDEAEKKDQVLSDGAKEARQFIETNRKHIYNAQYPDDEIIQEALRKIDALCDVNLEEGWILAALVASYRPKPDLVSYLEEHANRWLAEVERRVAAKEQPGQSGGVPFAYVAAGNLDLAIDCCRRLLDRSGPYGLGDGVIRDIKLCLANALIEREYYEDTLTNWPQDSALKIDELDALVDELSKTELPPDKRYQDVFKAALDDTIGFKKIVLGGEAPDIQAGLELCEKARRVTIEYNFKNGQEYCELHLRLGWRKMLEVEGKDQKSTPP